MNNQIKFNELRNKYQEFIYEKYEISITNNYLKLKYYFKIPNLEEFTPEIKINKEYLKNKYNQEYFNYLVFQIGLIELISYIKVACPKNIIIKAGYISPEQISFLSKLYYNGLGEFLYTNGITISEEELFKITCTHEKKVLPKINYQGTGNLICVGGGKDSCVSLEILKHEKNNSCFIINPKKPALESALAVNYPEKDIIKVERIIDKKLLHLNEQGYLNGHTPFSALIAFISYFIAYLSGKENIILSNEASANEPTVKGTNINHQYSKTYEFEKDFTNYMTNYVGLNIKYFSLLRGLSELMIAKLFSKYKKYHHLFRSCNLGSKNKEWNWCCNCPKCLFIYIILSPYLEKEELLAIFNEDLYQRKDLKETFNELIGLTTTKPFECVGTISEARYAISLAIKKEQNNLPYLLAYYQENLPLELNHDELITYNEENNLPEYFNNLVKKELNKYARKNN